MFVGWKKRVLRRGGVCALYAVLGESHRVDGKVRQKVLQHLAHIKDWHLDEMPQV